MNKKVILFDLDGTLTDPKIGITRSIQYALSKLGIDEPDLDKLECFIGPPLKDTFAEFYHFDKAQVMQAIEFYRERFKQKGMFENKCYPQIPELLKALKEKRITLVVATSKPTVFSEEILNFFDIHSYFDLIVGSHLDGTRGEKREIIQYALGQFPEIQKQEFVMIGDRKYDIKGAKMNGIDSIGVTYGYGSLSELRDAGPTHIAQSVDELYRLFKV